MRGGGGGGDGDGERAGFGGLVERGFAEDAGLADEEEGFTVPEGPDGGCSGSGSLGVGDGEWTRTGIDIGK